MVCKHILYIAHLTRHSSFTHTREVGWLVRFYGISTFVDYLTSNPFLCK